MSEDCHSTLRYDHIHEEVVECWLHGFADASKRAYCGVVYFVYRTSVGRYVRMLTSKTRLPHLKELSNPRLELMAALIMVKLVVSAEAAFSAQAKVKRNFGWTVRLLYFEWETEENGSNL